MKDRADKVLTDLKLVSSRSQAKSLIDKGDVWVNGVALKKSSEMIDSESTIEIKAPLFVGRGAFKIEKALEAFKIDVTNLVMMDVGASTGGFTEVLLLKGVARVYAIDVGRDQMNERIKNDPRVVCMEGTNIKDIKELPELADGAVMDLSFISITKVLETVKKLLKPGAPLIALVKPQFEAGVERLPKDGVIKDDKVREEILNEVVSYAVAHGWKHFETIPSPIEGKSGNKEYLSHFENV